MEDRRGKNVVDGGGGKSESDEQGTSSRTTLAELFSQPHDQEDPADKKEDDKEGENQEARITTVAELFSREADEEEPADKKEDDSSSSSRKQERVSITEKGSSSSRQHDHDSNPLLRAHLEPQLKLLRDCKDEVKDLEKDIEALQQCYELGGDENPLIQRISSSDFKELSANLDAKLQALKNSIDKKKELEEEIKELTEQVEFGCNLIVQCYAGINQQEAIPAEGEAKATDNPNIGILFAITPKYSGHAIEFYYKEANSDIVLHSVSTDCPQKWNKLAMQLPSLSTGKNFFEFVGSCNGLICYRTQTYWFSDVTCVYNPFTTESVAVFNETSASFKCIGFGYCISTKKYKLVRICEIDFGERRFQVNSLGEGRK
ncbi:uncharacterized protein LOC113309495 [Papaver somniferum]|uniref:uncharacterized protein LOC113309495 n=1 Tax=Papaver somniferum TaxID=3469 RepID=UPI000E703763|nr:uncharacterized protein LOC113309495 [Papaver somniferum]XP_026413704.1 uncharacterized protein LOC113309495 [Papaver somniferum]XP_026413705.1 uncharacterized protein LOC113309495 [Papaver somniferum]